MSVPVLCGESSAAQPSTMALRDHAVLHRWLGGLRSASCSRAASSRQGEYTENRAQTHQFTDTNQTSRASHDWLFQNDDHARSGDRPFHQSLRVWAIRLT